MVISPLVSAYFDADRAGDADALLSTFSPDAIVRDEGSIIKGHAALRTWWTAAKQKYHHVADPIDAVEEDGLVKVRANVSGNFPNSPAVLHYAFRLQNNEIIELEIK